MCDMLCYDGGRLLKRGLVSSGGAYPFGLVYDGIVYLMVMVILRYIGTI